MAALPKRLACSGMLLLLFASKAFIRVNRLAPRMAPRVILSRLLRLWEILGKIFFQVIVS